MEIIVPWVLLGLSLAANACLYELFRRARDSARKTPVPSLEAGALLPAQTRGAAVVKIEVIDAKNLLLRSPRG